MEWDHLIRSRPQPIGSGRERFIGFGGYNILLDDGSLAFEDREVTARISYIPYGTVHHFEDLLYHYTNTSALDSIISTSSLWLSRYSEMNDPLEFIYAWKLLERRVQHFANKQGNDISIDLLEQYRPHLTKSNYFVASFSCYGDSLHQWRAYAGKKGVSIGISKSLFDLRRRGISTDLHVTDVNYDIEDQKSTIDKIALDILKTGTISNNSFWTSKQLEKTKEDFHSVAITFKQPGYHHEQETRVYCKADSREVLTRRRHDGKQVQYVILDLFGLFLASEECDILFDTIGVAPSPHTLKSIKRVESVFRRYKIKCRGIIASAHKYNWK